jgi:penicillin-binding protein 1A
MMKDVCNTSGGTAYYANRYIKENYGEILGQIQGGKMPTAGKTGTTSADKDRWFMGYTPYYVAAVWYGYDSPVTVHLNSSYNPSLIIWHSVMQAIHKNLKPKDFPYPPNIVKQTVCLDSGKVPTDLCYHDPRGSRVKEEFFIKGTEPGQSDACDIHVKASVYKNKKDSSGGYLLAGSSVPTSSVIERVFIRRLIPYIPSYPKDPYPLDWKYELPKKYFNGTVPTPTNSEIKSTSTPDANALDPNNPDGYTDSETSLPSDNSENTANSDDQSEDGTGDVIIPNNDTQNSDNPSQPIITP